MSGQEASAVRKISSKAITEEIVSEPAVLLSAVEKTVLPAIPGNYGHVEAEELVP